MFLPATSMTRIGPAARLYATMRIVELIDKFAETQQRQILFVLSYSGQRVKRFVQEGSRFDQPLVEFLDRRGVPYVDLLAAHAADFKQFKVDADDYLRRYFIGHYNPAGNFSARTRSKTS